jgi:hypothetical protein
MRHRHLTPSHVFNSHILIDIHPYAGCSTYVNHFHLFDFEKAIIFYEGREKKRIFAQILQHLINVQGFTPSINPHLTLKLSY